MESGGIVITRNKIQIITLFRNKFVINANNDLNQIRKNIKQIAEKIQNTYKDYLINNYELDNLRKQKDNLNTNSSSGDFVVLVDDDLPF